MLGSDHARKTSRDWRTIFGDNKYHNHALEAWLQAERPNWRIEVKSRPEGTRGFTPLEKRWVVERTNAWNGRCRRNSKDYERRVESSAAMIQISNIHLMLRRLSPVKPTRIPLPNRRMKPRKYRENFSDSLLVFTLSIPYPVSLILRQMALIDAPAEGLCVSAVPKFCL